MSRSIIRSILTDGRPRRFIVLLVCGMLAVIWSEGIAIAQEVNPPTESAAAETPAPTPPTTDADEEDEPAGIELRPQEMIIAAIGAMAIWIFFASGWHTLQRVPRRPHPLTPGLGFLLLVILLLAGIIGAVTAQAVFAIGDELEQADNPARAYALLAGGSLLAQAIILIGLAVYWRKHRRAIHETRPHPVNAFVLGLGGFVIFWPIVLLVSFIASAITILITGKPIEPIAHDTLALFRDHPIDQWMLVLTVLVIIGAPVIEEVMYRGVVQESLGQLGLSRWTAIVLTSVFFAAMHLPTIKPHALATLFVLSLGFGWIYEKTGRLAAPIAMHMAFNAANVAMVMVMM